MSIQVTHTFKDHGVRIKLPPDHAFTEIDTIDQKRVIDKNGNDIGSPEVDDPRIVIDFTLSKVKATGEATPFNAHVSIKVYIIEGDLGGLDPKLATPEQLRDAIHGLRIFNYNEAKSEWVEFTNNVVKGVFTETQMLFGAIEYFGFISVDTDISSDPPIAVGR